MTATPNATIENDEHGIVRHTPDFARAEKAAREFMRALGIDIDQPGLRDTPDRVTRAYAQLLTPREFDGTLFEDERGYTGLVQVSAIRFVSVCEHHLFPFTGLASVGYVPRGKLLGLSKLARAVEYFSAAPQVQERLTGQVANWLEETTGSPDVGVIVRAEHSCMSLRGVRAAGTWTTTSDLRGELRQDLRLNQEFFRNARGSEV